MYCRLLTHTAGSAPLTDGGWPISMMVVLRKPSLTTSPRTPPRVIRSPTPNVSPRRITKYAASDRMTCCSANASPALTSPTPVLRSVSGVTQIDTTPSSSTTAATTWMPWRVQNRRGSATCPPSSRRVSHSAAPRSAATSSTSATVNSSFTAVVVLTPTSVTPNTRTAPEAASDASAVASTVTGAPAAPLTVAAARGRCTGSQVFTRSVSVTARGRSGRVSWPGGVPGWVLLAACGSVWGQSARGRGSAVRTLKVPSLSSTIELMSDSRAWPLLRTTWRRSSVETRAVRIGPGRNPWW